MIIGCCGAGKSTFARKLKSLINLEVIHLDQFYWNPNWVETEKPEWEMNVKELADKEEWIIDGNYEGTMDLRIVRADTIIYLDRSTLLCLWRVLLRTVKNFGQVRLDMPEGCKERFSLSFLHYVATYNLLRRNQLLDRIEIQSKTKKIYHLTSSESIKKFFNNLSE
jgi:adenylate kinase family enzyme